MKYWPDVQPKLKPQAYPVDYRHDPDRYRAARKKAHENKNPR